MPRKRGHWKGFLTAEDGSILRVVGGRPEVIRPKNSVEVERRVRALADAKRERDTQRAESRAVREAYGVAIR
jgi:hypothetical protein